ncbi:MAG: epimerase [Comamonadaceae bacterium]|nr:MAG: epimerase [Comamonadaceae bacterium]
MTTRMTPSDLHLLRTSLVAVWLGTAIASAVEYQGASQALLAQAGLHSPGWMQTWIWGGIAADTVIGLALWRRPGRPAYAAALALMLVMTATATALLPSLWLDPLGPLLKNLPIAALLLVLYRSEVAS